MVYPPFMLKVQTGITSSRQTNPPAFSALFPEMESVPEKRFSGQNLADYFWIVVEDLLNILFQRGSVNPSIIQYSGLTLNGREAAVIGRFSFYGPSPPMILSRLPMPKPRARLLHQ